MSRLSAQQKIAILKFKNRQAELMRLLDSYDWKTEGYADKFAWLRDMYGPGHDQDLLEKCQQQFEQESLL